MIKKTAKIIITKKKVPIKNFIITFLFTAKISNESEWKIQWMTHAARNMLM